MFFSNHRVDRPSSRVKLDNYKMSLHRASSENQTATEKISSSLEKELIDLQNLSKDCSIYRVPHRLRQVNRKAYTPQVVSVGPIHHGKKELKAMEEHKRRYLQHFLHLGDTVGLNDYVDFVRKKETDLRNCYAETIHLSTEEFIKMILIDSAFLILILVQGTFKLDMTDDRILNRPVMMFEVRDDILLLENQLPFFILQELFELSEIAKYLQDYDISALPDLREGIDLIKLTYRFFENWIAVPEMINKIHDIQVEHLLHFLRICYIPQMWHLERKETKILSLPSAMELYQAGVNFELVCNGNLFDINFMDGILKIPQLEILDSTVIIFHNLCAYEQCHYITDSSGHIVSMNQECHCLSELISDYITIMFQLVKSAKDVELLIQKGIIVNRAFSSERVASFFHKLDVGVNVTSSRFCYGKMIEDLNKYCGARWPKWKATLMKDYFKNPWTGISASAAGILLLLTIIQTVCSILQVKNPS